MSEISRRRIKQKTIQLNAVFQLGILATLLVFSLLALLENVDPINSIFTQSSWSGTEFSDLRRSIQLLGVVGAVISYLLPLLCLGLMILYFFSNTRVWHQLNVFTLAGLLVLNWGASLWYSIELSRDVNVLFGFASFPFTFPDFYDSETSLPEVGLLVLAIVAVASSTVNLVLLKLKSNADKPKRSSLNQASREKGFMSSLFDLIDLKFDRFIYVKVSTFMYMVVIIVLVLLNLGFGVFAFYFLATGREFMRFLPILLWPASILSSFVLLIIVRLALESGVALIKIAENTSKK